MSSSESACRHFDPCFPSHGVHSDNVPDAGNDSDIDIALLFFSKENCSAIDYIGSFSIDVSNWTAAICDTNCRDPGIFRISLYNKTGVLSVSVEKPVNSSQEYDCFVWEGDCFNDRPLRTVSSEPGDCLNLELTNDIRIRCNGRSNSVVCPRN